MLMPKDDWLELKKHMLYQDSLDQFPNLMMQLIDWPLQTVILKGKLSVLIIVFGRIQSKE